MSMEKEETNQSKVIIITGMHRSGTSLVASLMQSAGVDVGDDLMAATPSNIHGYFEDVDFYHFHEGILREDGKTYLVGGSLRISDDKLEQAQALIAKRRDKPVWGWKDPRTTLFLDLWLQLLPNAHFLFVYRHPIEVFLSLLKRADREITENPAAGLKAWQVYNEHILHFMGKHPEQSTLCHVMGILQHKEEFNKLVRLRLGLTKTPNIRNRYHADSLHRLSVPDWLTQSIRHIFPQVIELYEQLQASAHLPFVYSTTGPKSADGDVLPLLDYTTKALMVVHTNLRKQDTANPVFQPQLFWAGGNEEFSAKHAISLSAPMGPDRQNLIFLLPRSANNLQRLRLDPAGRPGFFHLFKVALKWSDLEGKQEKLLWQLRGAREIARCSQMEGVHFCTAALGEVFLSTSDDPQIAFELPKDVKADAGEGVLQFEIEMDWPKSADYLIAEDAFGRKMAVQARQIDAKENIIEEQARQIDAKENIIEEQARQIDAKENIIEDQARQIDAKENIIEEQARQIDAKDTHIHNIESELNMIKQSKVWRIAEFFRRLVYLKLLGKFPLLQKGLLTITRGGFETFYIKARRKLTAFYRTKKRKLQKGHKLILSNEQIEPYETYTKNNQVQPHIRKLLSNASTQFQYRPLISIIMPVYNVKPRWLKAAVDSVIGQIYTNWELCIADDASTNNETLELLKSYENHDRIKVVFRTQNGHICAASNSAEDLAEGEFVAFMDNDDLLAPNALLEIARMLQDDPDVDLIYSDEDKIDENDKRYDPQFKPDWSPELFLSYNYVNHFTCVRRKVFESVGRFRTGYEGAQDYDLILRVIENTNKIRHIPKVLYHWRAIKGSTALEARDKPIMHTSALKGLKDHLERKGIEAAIYQPGFARSMCLPISQLDWPDNGPSVAIIIPTYNQYRLLRKCIESISDLTTYTNYEIVVVDNDSDDRDTLTYLEGIADKGIRVERIGNDGQPFSFSRINNLAVERVDTEYILFLNNDIEGLEPRWLSRLAGYLGIPGVGATGARLLYPNKTIQHAGVVMGMNDGIIPDHGFLNHHKDDISYYFLAEVARNCSAVTGACLMTRRSDFIRIGGFNERDFKVTLQDVDYCLNLAKKGLRTVYVAGAELIHYGSMSRQVEDHSEELPRLRKTEDDPRELARLRKTHVMDNDPYYNPNLSRIHSFVPNTGCGMVDYCEYLKDPLKVVIFTHDLELKGAPKAMYDLAVGLQTQSGGKIVSKVVSPVTGPFKSFYDRAGIECRVIDLNSQNIAAGWSSKRDYGIMIKRLEEFWGEERPDVVISNTVFGFYVIHAAQQQRIPVIWIISESYTPTELEYSINDFAWPECEHSFARAYRVVFGSAATMNCYKSFNSRHNFQAIHNSIDRRTIDRFIKDVSKEEARQNLGVAADKKMLLMVGTICERKGQKAIVEAVAILKKQRNDFCVYLVGASMRADDVYLQGIFKEVNNNNLANIIRIVPETEELYWYYRASDIFVFTSLMECYPISIIEAMAFGLPVITTPCYGVKEQVRDVNGLFFDESNADGLAVLVHRLLDDKAEREYLGRNSRSSFEYQQTYEEMIEKYKHLVFGAWIRGNSRNKK